MEIETIIFQNIIANAKYRKKVIPFISPVFFKGGLSIGDNRLLFRILAKYVKKYSNIPNLDEFSVEITQSDLIRTDDKRSELLDFIPIIYEEPENDYNWLVDKTEEWCKFRAIQIAMFEANEIFTNKDKKRTASCIPELLSKAINFSFDNNIGHDFFEDMEERFDFYNSEEEKIPFDLSKLNEITHGGLRKKSLMVVMASTGVGKSLFMCHLGASYLTQGHNVLYITLEMAEKSIAERIDANILDVPIDKIHEMPKNDFTKQITELKTKSNGRMIIKEYPPVSAHAGHFRALLNDLKMKKNFIPGIIIIDYLNICASERIKSIGGGINSYSYVKAIAEEIRGIAVEFDVPLITATQTNRGGYNNSDFDLENSSDSFGVPATADLMIGLMIDEQVNPEECIKVKQLKNRFADFNRNKAFYIGVDRGKMRLHDYDYVPPEIEPIGNNNKNQTELFEKFDPLKKKEISF